MLDVGTAKKHIKLAFGLGGKVQLPAGSLTSSAWYAPKICDISCAKVIVFIRGASVRSTSINKPKTIRNVTKLADSASIHKTY